MDLQKGKIFLDKINREFTAMQRHPEGVSAIDVDILRQYIRDFYDAILSEKTTVVITAPAELVKEVPIPKLSSRPIAFDPERPDPKKAAPPQEVYIDDRSRRAANTPPVEEISRAGHSPIIEQKAQPFVAPEPPKKQVRAHELVIEPPVPQSVKPEPSAKLAKDTPDSTFSPETLALFEFEAPKELSEKLSETPIADLKKAFSLNDRLLMTTELFGGDSKSLENTVVTVQGLSSFEEAKSYLIQFCAERYAWAEKNKIEPARRFIKIVRRRFAK
jgi:hypothetical protein